MFFDLVSPYCVPGRVTHAFLCPETIQSIRQASCLQGALGIVRSVDELRLDVTGTKAELLSGDRGTSGQDAITCKETESCLKGAWPLSEAGFLEVVTWFMKSGRMAGHISIMRRKWRPDCGRAQIFF